MLHWFFNPKVLGPPLKILDLPLNEVLFHSHGLAYLFSSDVDNAEREPSSPRQRYPPSSSKIDKGVLLGNDLAKAHTAVAKKYSLPPRARKDIPQIETRARTRSVDNEVQEAYDNLAISTETNDEATPRKKLSLTNRLESPFYTEPTTKASVQPLPSARARYSKRKKGEVVDSNANALPAVKDEVQRKGSVVLVSKSQTGETCFQVKTPADFRKTPGKEKIQSSEEFNVWLGYSNNGRPFEKLVCFSMPWKGVLFYYWWA